MTHWLDDNEPEQVAAPPAKGASRVSPWPARLAPVKAKPGVWFRWPNPHEARAEASNIKNGKYGGLEAGEYVAHRAYIEDDDGAQYYTYCMYMGEVDLWNSKT
jgi:hypothetical protein